MLIDMNNVTRKFVSGNVETTALNNIAFSVKEGEFVAIMGPSGCGKSTLLNTIGLLDDKFTGNYEFLGKNIKAIGRSNTSKLRGSNISFVFQNFNLINHLSVYHNIELSLLYKNINSDARNRMINEVMEQVEIKHRRDHLPTVLSGGEQQRVALARATVSRPKLILADEPTGNLDPERGNQVMELMMNLKDSGTSIVMVTHSESQAEYADRVVRLRLGNIEK